MNADRVRKFLHALNATNVQMHSKWGTASCPLAPWRHKGGKDSRPSFGISISQGKSHFHCFSCGSGGSLDSLLMELTHWNKDASYAMDFATAFKLADEDTAFVEGPEWSPLGTKRAKPEPWPLEWLSSFRFVRYCPEAVEYLENRNVSLELALTFNLRWDSDRKAICFPYYTDGGQFAGMRGRIIDPSSDIKYFDYTWKGVNNNKLLWYWGHRVDWNRPLVITEGSFDAIAVYRWYHNVASPFSCGVSEEKSLWLQQAIAVICLFDADEAGDAGYEKLVRTVGKTVAVRRLRPPEGMDASSMSPEDLKAGLKTFVTLA